MPFVRKGLIDGVYGSSAGEVPPREALQKMIEKMGVWVSEVGPHEAELSPLSPTSYGRKTLSITVFFPGRTYRWAWAE